MDKDLAHPSGPEAGTPSAPADGATPRPPAGGLSAGAESLADVEKVAIVSATTAAIEATSAVAKEALRFSSRNLLTWFILGLLAVGLYFAYVLLRPFANTLVLAVVFAALFAPVYKFFLTRFRGRESLASLVVLAFVIIVVIVPLTLLITGLIPQMRHSVTSITAWLSEGNLDDIFTNYLNPFFELLHEEAPFLDITPDSAKADILDAARRVGQELLGLSANFVGGTLTFVMHFLLFLVALFFFLKDGAGMIARLKYLTPLREEQQERILNTLSRVSRSVLAGGFLVAALQGAAGGIGLAIVGIPALFWGTVMALSAFVPVVGTGLVWVPAVCFLIFINAWKSAIFLALWCGVLVTSIDTFLRPYLMRDASGVPILFLFLAILGGIQAFGIFGLLYGPIILTFAVVMLKIYADEYQEQLKSKNAWAKQSE
ncbi:MAG: AI-2E family transporter [Deltaproteobacteria bacterium]|nr:AI-2E family transporter [Deltaproteobacteria bacterium]